MNMEMLRIMKFTSVPIKILRLILSGNFTRIRLILRALTRGEHRHSNGLLTLKADES